VPVRARSEEGFGLIELLIAMTVLAVGILALVAGLTSGYLALNRASDRGSAAALADSQLEKYRALDYASIGLTFTGYSGYTPSYTTDTGCTSTTSTVYGSTAAACTTTSATASNGATVTPCGSSGAVCTPVQASVTGPDNKIYRIDTLIRWATPSSGRAGKIISVVVRNSAGTELARVQATFDPCTGLTSSATSC